MVEGIASYYFEVEVGTPPRLFRLIADTGSSFMAITGAGCEAYPKPDNPPTTSHYTCPYVESTGPCPSFDVPYNATASSSSSQVSCTQDLPGYNYTCSCWGDTSVCALSLVYGDGSCADGWVVNDVISVYGDTLLNTTAFFGYLQDEAGDLASSDTDGIIGLAYSSLSNGFPTFIDQLVTHEGMDNVFAMCLGGPNASITLGGLDSELYVGSISYTPITSETYYVVDLMSVSLSGQSVSVTLPAIVDSGTTGLVLDTTTFEALLFPVVEACDTSAFCSILANSITSPGTGYCLDSELSTAQLKDFPHFVFEFPDAEGNTFSVKVTAEAYLTQIPDSNCYLVLIFPGDDMSILGDTFMKSSYVIFDRANKQIGFAESDCLKGGVGDSYFWYYIGGGAVAFVVLLSVGIFFVCRRNKSGYKPIPIQG